MWCLFSCCLKLYHQEVVTEVQPDDSAQPNNNHSNAEQLIGVNNKKDVNRVTIQYPNRRRKRAYKKAADNNDISRNQLTQEIAVLQHIWDAGGHKNIIQMFGIPNENPTLCTTIYLEPGDLDLQQYINDLISENDDSAIFEVPSDFYKQLASALKFLHSDQVGIVHCDLKPENVLITGRNQDICKIIDFGLSKTNQQLQQEQRCGGTLGFAAPEVTRDPQQPAQYELTNKIDIFSLALLFFIMLVKDNISIDLTIPISVSDQQRDKYVQTQLNQAWRPTTDYLNNNSLLDIPEVVETSNLLQRMWNQNPNERPNMNEICEVLDTCFPFVCCGP